MPPTSKPEEPEGGDSTIERENGDTSASSSCESSFINIQVNAMGAIKRKGRPAEPQID